MIYFFIVIISISLLFFLYNRITQDTLDTKMYKIGSGIEGSDFQIMGNFIEQNCKNIENITQISANGGLSNLLKVNKGEYNFGERHRAGIGLDIFYDEIYSIRTTREIYENSTKNNAFFSGINSSYDFVFGKMSFSVQGGFHPTVPTSGYPRVYQRFCLKQRISKHFVEGVALKSYLGKAQFIEWRAGYYFSRKLKAK